jgi:hypothetical protein
VPVTLSIANQHVPAPFVRRSSQAQMATSRVILRRRRRSELAFGVTGCTITSIAERGAQLCYRDLSVKYRAKIISVLPRVRVLVMLGRIATAVHPASSAVGHVDVVRMEPLLPPVMMMVTPVGVGSGD